MFFLNIQMYPRVEGVSMNRNARSTTFPSGTYRLEDANMLKVPPHSPVLTVLANFKDANKVYGNKKNIC